MALDITFSTAIDSERTTVTLTDSTVYGTGGNPARASLGVFVSVCKVAYDGTETDLTVTSDDDDPETDSSWTFSYTNGDGYYKIRYVAIPDFNSSSTYDQYDAVYSSGSAYRSKTDGNTEDSLVNATYWEALSDPADLADNKDEDNESTNIDSLVYERVFTANAQYAYGNLISENSMHTESDDEDLMDDYDLFSLWLNGALTSDERTEVLQGELICRRIQSRFIDE